MPFTKLAVNFTLTIILVIPILVACIDNCNIRASKPADRFQNNHIPTNNEVQRDIWWESAVQGIFCLSDSPLSR